MDLTKTREALIREAADKLNIVGTGQSLEAEYADQLDRSIDGLFAQLASDGICNVADPQTIPIEWFDALAGLLANQCAAAGGKGFDPQIRAFYEATLRRLTASQPSYRTLDAEYF